MPRGIPLRDKPWEREGKTKRTYYVQKWRRDHPKEYKEKYAVYNDRAACKRHGITMERYAQLRADQGGRCAICKRLPTIRRLSFDHCHKTGKFRGLLCQRCNLALGPIEVASNPRMYVEQLVRWIEKHKG